MYPERIQLEICVHTHTFMCALGCTFLCACTRVGVCTFLSVCVCVGACGYVPS